VFPKTALRLGAFYAGAAVLVAFAGCMDSGNGPDKDPDPGADTVAYAIARVLTVALDDSGRLAGDTTVTTYTYDANGRLVRERTGTFVREWDSLGRYRGSHNAGASNPADYHEILDWVSADSNVRSQGLGSSIVFNDRFYGRRPNCWCADSIRHHAGTGAYIATRRFRYDSDGFPVLVTVRRTNPPRVDTVQRYQNAVLILTRSNGASVPHLLARNAFDAESGDTTRQFFEYAPLDSLLEAR
jgi:hypothetical protein